MAERLNAGNFESRAFQPGKLALIDFYSDSCIPCKMLSPLLAELEEKYAGQLYVGKVNIAYESELVARYGVMSAPTLILFRGGQQVTKLTGAKKKAELETLIEENL